MAALVALLGMAVAVVEIAQADPLQGADRPAGDLVAAGHHEGREHRQHHEGERSRIRRLRCDVAVGDAGLDHHQREFRDLREIKSRQQARAQPLLHQVERRKGGDEAAHDREGRDHQREPDHGEAGYGNGHAERDEEQRDEEVAERGDLGGDVERIGEGRERDAGDQRAHLARQRQLIRGLRDQEAPGQRAEQDQLGPPGDLVEHARQHIAADQQRSRDQHRDAADREQDDADLQIGETRLHRQEQDGEDVLEHQHAEGDAARQRVELALFVEHLDDDDRARQRAGDAEIDRIEMPAAERQADADEEQNPEQTAAEQLAARREQDHPPGPHDLLQVDLEPDHEQHEDQAELGDDADRFLRMDPAGAEWTYAEAGDKVGQDQRLPGKMGEQPQHPGEQDRECDIANELVHAKLVRFAAP